MTLVAIGLAVSFNIIILIWKFRHNRTADGILDTSLLALVMWIFSGSTDLLIIGTIGSLIVSIYLLFAPVKFKHAYA
jgi:hypothetical protein